MSRLNNEMTTISMMEALFVAGIVRAERMAPSALDLLLFLKIFHLQLHTTMGMATR